MEQAGKREHKLKQLTEWAESNEDIRAMLLTSSLVNPMAPVDEFSDLDIELVIANLPDFLNDDSWISNFGKPIATVAEGEAAFGGRNASRMVLYDDYVKVDFLLYGVTGFRREVNNPVLHEDWDIGYRVLVDKDNLAGGMKPPTYRQSLIKKPSAEVYAQVFNDFWWDMTYVAKCLARDEIFYARFMTENMMRTDYLVPIIEWYIGSRHDWNVTTNKHGRLFKRYLSPELWTRVEATFAGSGPEENWAALFAFADLGHELGVDLAGKLGYTYPHQLEKDIRKYLADVKAGTFGSG